MVYGKHRVLQAPHNDQGGAGIPGQLEGLMVTQGENPLLTAVTVLVDEPSLPFSKFIAKIGLDHLQDITFFFENDTPNGFMAKKQWLRTTFGLVDAAKDGPGPKGGDRLLVYEDARVNHEFEGRRYHGVWRVSCYHSGGESKFSFRYWDRGGQPTALGEDSMTDALQRFQETFKPDRTMMEQYQIEVDYSKLARLSKYPIKRF